MDSKPRARVVRNICWMVVPLFWLAGCVIVFGGHAPSNSAAGAGATQTTGAGGTRDGESMAGAPGRVQVGTAPDAGVELHGQWENVTGNLAGMKVGCGNLMLVAAHPDVDLVFIGVANSGLWSFKPSDTSWTLMNGGAKDATLNGGPIAVTFAPNAPDRFWVTTIYGERGVYETLDRGATFHSANEVRHLDAIAVNTGDSDLVPWVVGGHESDRQLWTSKDHGKSWDSIGDGLPAGKSCTHPAIIDSNTFLVGCSYNAEGIYRSTDRGKTWTQVSLKGGIGSPVVLSDSILWSTQSGALISSSDQGESWSEVSPPDTIKSNGVGPILLPNAQIAAVGKSGVAVSSNGGKSWKVVSTQLPYGDVNGFAYSTFQHAFFVKHNTCSEPVPTDAVMRYAWDPSSPL